MKGLSTPAAFPLSVVAALLVLFAALDGMGES